MKHPVKTLAALAILSAVAPSAHAVSLKDDVLSITPTVRLQTRAQISDATTGADAATPANVGEEYRVAGGVPNATNDPIDFSLRRARLGLNFKYGANWKGQFTLMADNVDRAPKFDFDDAELLPEDRDVLEQVAKCVTTGPLKGRKLALVGRADPRGDTEYNMVLGSHRAHAVNAYLSGLGVDQKRLRDTSRGELDATGTDEGGFRLDRRVDIRLAK